MHYYMLCPWWLGWLCRVTVLYAEGTLLQLPTTRTWALPMDWEVWERGVRSRLSLIPPPPSPPGQQYCTASGFISMHYGSLPQISYLWEPRRSLKALTCLGHVLCVGQATTFLGGVRVEGGWYKLSAGSSLFPPELVGTRRSRWGSGEVFGWQRGAATHLHVHKWHSLGEEVLEESGTFPSSAICIKCPSKGK